MHVGKTGVIFSPIEMDLDQVPLLRRNKLVELNTATPWQLVKIHLIASSTHEIRSLLVRFLESDLRSLSLLFNISD